MKLVVGSISVAELCDIYIEYYARLNKKSWNTDERRVRRYIIPILGALSLDEVTHAHICEIYSTIGKSRPSEAKRVRDQLHKMFELAKEWDYLSNDAVNPAKKLDDDDFQGAKKTITAITLNEAWRDYSDARDLKRATYLDYVNKLKNVEDWLDLDMNQISKDMVEQRHREMSRRAPMQANYTFRVIRTIYNFAIYKYEVDGEPVIKQNPVKRLSQIKAWNRERARTRHVPLHRLKDWFGSVLMLDALVMRDYLIVLLFTGMRHAEAVTLKWDFIDWEGGYINLPETKNGEPHTLPMTIYLRELLRERYANRANEYVFPGGKPFKPKGHMLSPYKAIDRVIASTGIKFSPHDLRRTFNIIAEDAGIDEFTRKRLLNHSLQDVTGRHYSVKNPERLRGPMELISSHVLKLAGLLE
ncbi:MAG: site-specific integrase [Candidatus Obscuribacterales bacterium]|nr:site-specific integrase [Candidatus Obscuribacterales bacterium]